MNKTIPLIILTALIFLIAKCGHSIYSGIKNFPEYATSEVLSEKYPQLIADIDEQIAKGTTLSSIELNLKNIDYPAATIYVAIEKDDDNDIVIKGSKTSKSRSRVIMNGFGYGKLDKLNVVIISRSVDNFEIDDVVVYLKHED